MNYAKKTQFALILYTKSHFGAIFNSIFNSILELNSKAVNVFSIHIELGSHLIKRFKNRNHFFTNLV